jgi:hypothetical protein
MTLHDFKLPNADGGEVAYDAEYRLDRNVLLFWYRGYW